MGVVVRRYIDILTIIINFPTPLLHVSALFLAAASLLLCSLTLGAHVRSEGYCSCRVCMCMCMCVYVCPLITAASHIGITKQRYQRVHSNTAII